MLQKIAIVSASLQLGGIEKASSTLANSLSELGHEVSFLCVFKHQAFFSLHPQVVLLQPEKAQNRKNLFASPWRLRKQIKQINPDVVIVYNKFYGALTLLGTLGLNKRIIVSERASPDYQFPKLIEWFMNVVYTFKKPTGVIAQTHYAKQKQQKYYGSNVPIEVIPNIIQTKTIPKVNKEQWVLAVGRFGDKLKGFDRLVEAWAKVTHQDWTLVFAGGEPSDPEISYLVQKYNMTNVLFLGKVANMEEIYAKASIFVIPSRSEGFPNALAEAMCYGLPVISFNFKAGPQDLINHESNGILVPEGDVDALAQSINEMIVDEGKRSTLGSNAIQTKSVLDKDYLIDKIINFING